jgi:tripartite-type tricarboxylate transporter receptor subunit TctC
MPRYSKKYLCAAALVVLAGIVDAAAQTYPVRPITMIVPYPPGGPTDTLGRLLAERMRTTLGQPVIVENVGGAGGTIGATRAVRAAPDGYTINFSNVASHVFSNVVYKLPFDIHAELEPIALLTISPVWIIARNSLPAKDVKELVAWLKANPDKATWGIVGPGSPAHLCGVYFEKNTGTRVQFVPYRGAGPIIQDLVSGQIDLTCIEASASRPAVQGGKVKAYALLAQSRWAASPDTPTIDEAGVPGLYLPFWHGMWAPKGTPADVIGRLNGALVEALADPAVSKRFTDLGVAIAPREQQNPDGLRSHHKAELDKWRPIIEAANIKPE